MRDLNGRFRTAMLSSSETMPSADILSAAGWHHLVISHTFRKYSPTTLATPARFKTNCRHRIVLNARYQHSPRACSSSTCALCVLRWLQTTTTNIILSAKGARLSIMYCLLCQNMKFLRRPGSYKHDLAPPRADASRKGRSSTRNFQLQKKCQKNLRYAPQVEHDFKVCLGLMGP